MKKYLALFLAVFTLLSVLAFNVYAEESETTNGISEESALTQEASDEASTDVSDETSVIVFQEHPNKQFTWAYWLIGIVSILAVAFLCVAVTIKFKNK